MRKYQPAWEQLKQTGKVVINANPRLHARIRKAITKEKYYDTGYKLEWLDIKASEYPVLEVQVSKEDSNVLIFTLRKPIYLGEL